jgi:hypothetical protein
MSTSSRHGGKNRKLSDHILNHKCSMERMNWKKPRTPPPPKACSQPHNFPSEAVPLKAPQIVAMTGDQVFKCLDKLVR